MSVEGVKKMHVRNRAGEEEGVKFDKITQRIEDLCISRKIDNVDARTVAHKVIHRFYSGIKTSTLDNLTSECAISMITRHPDYAVLASAIAISNNHKETKSSFSAVTNDLYTNVDAVTKVANRLVSHSYFRTVMENSVRLNSAIDYDKDFNYDYFGFKTLEESVLMKINGKVVERPQHFLMRVAVGIHGNDIDGAIETYNLMSEKYFTHSTPTLLFAGKTRQLLSNCFIVKMKEDSLEGIYSTLKECALALKCGGGVAVDIHSIRGKGTAIAGCEKRAMGIVALVKLLGNTVYYIKQGSMQPGAMAVYLEPWHVEIFEYLDLYRRRGSDDYEISEVVLSVWIPDLFMERVEKDEEWCLMCPKKCPGLSECWGEEFNELYRRYERENNYVKKVKAKDIFRRIFITQVETGKLSVVYKDACNRKSNQSNLGCLKASNLCTGVVQYTSSEEIAMCNLASIAVNMFVQPNGNYDLKKLKEITKIVTNNLNKVIDANYYLLPGAEASNKKHRPMGIGVQGLADAFILMRYPFDSDAAKELNKQIFETLYYGALEASCELAAQHGTYESYEGSPASKGVLQFDMWGVTPSNLWDWDALRKKIAEHGLRNSLMLAVVPTTLTSRILGNSESIEPYASNINCIRHLSCGKYHTVNNHLMRDLFVRGLWNEEIMNKIMAAGGSIQDIHGVSSELKMLYRTAWEIPFSSILEMAADRGAFIDQSQSMNVFIPEPSFFNMALLHMEGWKRGLKTGLYQLRSKTGKR